MAHPTDGSPAEAVNPVERREAPPASMSDMTIAQAIAQAVREVPGVLDLSLGWSALVATYGAGQRVAGVVIHHPVPGETRVEVHAVLSERHARTMRLDAAAGETGSRSRRQPILIQIADQIRSAVERIASALRQPALVGVDVFIDDLR